MNNEPTTRRGQERVSAAQAADLLERFDRIGVGVRCGYQPFCACLVHHYVDAGERVVATGSRSELQVQQRLLQVLLQAARDDALPAFWRSVCWHHAGGPLERLAGLLAPHDPIACHALRSAVQAAGNELASAMARRDPR